MHIQLFLYILARTGYFTVVISNVIGHFLCGGEGIQAIQCTRLLLWLICWSRLPQMFTQMENFTADGVFFSVVSGVRFLQSKCIEYVWLWRATADRDGKQTLDLLNCNVFRFYIGLNYLSSICFLNCEYSKLQATDPHISGSNLDSGNFMFSHIRKNKT